MSEKIRTNVYLNRKLKEKAKKIFEHYGLSFSDGINLLLMDFLKTKELPVPFEDKKKNSPPSADPVDYSEIELFDDGTVI